MPTDRVTDRRTKCAACKIIARDMEAYKRYVYIERGQLFRDSLDEKFCETLGMNHQPYEWLEGPCIRMVEDKIGKSRARSSGWH